MSAIGMPSHLLAFFAPRPPLEQAPIRGRRQRPEFDGLASLVNMFEKETFPTSQPPFISPQERRLKQKQANEKEHIEIQNRQRALYDPNVDPEKQKTSDPRKTLFVGRLSYETTEKKLLKTFEAYGQIRDIRVVCDSNDKPRGYAFIEFKNEEGMWNAYKNANQKIIDGRSVLVDTEKARIVAGWLPRRLGGGEGLPRKGVAPIRTRLIHSSEVTPHTRYFRGGPSRGVGGGRGGSYRGGGGVGARPPPRYSTSRGPPPTRRGGGAAPYESRSYESRAYDSGNREVTIRPGDFARPDHRNSDYSSRYYH